MAATKKIYPRITQIYTNKKLATDFSDFAQINTDFFKFKSNDKEFIFGHR